MVVAPGTTRLRTRSSPSRTPWPLRRIFSISAGDLQTIAILDVVVDNAKNLFRHLIGRQIAVHRVQTPLGLVILSYWPRLLIEFVQTRPNHFFTIVVADNQLCAVNVTKLIDLGWLKVDVVDPSTGGTRTTSGKPAQQLIIVDLEPDHNRQPIAAVRVVKELIFQVGIQPARLGRGSRKA